MSEHEAALIRFALGADGVVAPDPAARAPGRGAWVRADRASVLAAVKRGAFARSFKQAVKAGDDLADRAEQALVRRCLDLLGVARGAGALAFGFQGCEESIKRARPLWHIEAHDGAADGRRRLLRLAESIWGRPSPVCGCFSGSEIGMALGRDDVVHAILLQEGLAQRWSAELGRLAGFRAIAPPEWS